MGSNTQGLLVKVVSYTNKKNLQQKVAYYHQVENYQKQKSSWTTVAAGAIGGLSCNSVKVAKEQQQIEEEGEEAGLSSRMTLASIES